MSRVLRAGLDVVRASGREALAAGGFARAAWRIDRDRQRQTAATVLELERRFNGPTFTDVWVWDLVERLAQCVDPTDCRMLGASQLVHVGQVITSMERDGVDDPDFYVAAMLHDLGKLLLLRGVDAHHVVGSTVPIGTWVRGAGLDQACLQWGHAEYAYQHLRGALPDHLGWLIRYHNIDPGQCASAMDARDLEYVARYLRPFRRYDRAAKSAFRMPGARLSDYRDLVEKRFPDPINF